MKVTITGAGGYLGRGLVIPFEEAGVDLRLVDVRPFESKHEVVVGDIADLDVCRAITKGVDGLVIAHMAPNPTAYVNPVMPFDVNVKGTANLLFACHENGVKRAVLISSTAAVLGWGKDQHLHNRERPFGKGMYSLTKICQEVIAEHLGRDYGISIKALRIGYVMDGDTMLDKYGRKVTERPSLLADRRDIGEVARLCLLRDDIKWDIFNVMSTEDAQQRWDVAYTSRVLNWKPKYDFSWLPVPKPPC